MKNTINRFTMSIGFGNNEKPWLAQRKTTLMFTTTFVYKTYQIAPYFKAPVQLKQNLQLF